MPSRCPYRASGEGGVALGGFYKPPDSYSYQYNGVLASRLELDSRRDGSSTGLVGAYMLNTRKIGF